MYRIKEGKDGGYEFIDRKNGKRIGLFDPRGLTTRETRGPSSSRQKVKPERRGRGTRRRGRQDAEPRDRGLSRRLFEDTRFQTPPKQLKGGRKQEEPETPQPSSEVALESDLSFEFNPGADDDEAGLVPVNPWLDFDFEESFSKNQDQDQTYTHTIGFPEFLRKNLHKSYNEQIACKGCAKVFDCYKKPRVCYPCPAYYYHILEECKEYKKLNEIRECHICCLRLISPTSLRKHNGLYHPHRKAMMVEGRPKWMAEEVMRKIVMYANFPHKVTCSGCGQDFPSYTGCNSTAHSFAYYAHCLTQCEAYKALGRIRKCPRCSCLFLNKRTFGWHEKVCRQ